MFKGKIDIGSILNKIDHVISESDQVRTFGLLFLKKDGKIGRLEECRKGVKNPRASETADVNGRSRQKFNLKEKGIIKLWDEKKQRFSDVKVGAILGFRDFQSNSWLMRSW